MFTGTCPANRRVRLIANPTQEDGVTPAKIDPENPLSAIAVNGEAGFVSTPVPGTPTECYVEMPDSYTGPPVAIRVTADANMRPGTDNFRPITEDGTIDFVAPEAFVVGTGVSAPEAKASPNP